jgi:lipopolysaccharide transport system ATP-binding protein
MSAPIITIRGLGKRYRLGGTHGHDTLRDQITHGVKALGGLFQGKPSQPGDEYLWALKDVSFDVAPGEVVGLIGRNGAGKSTLLKVLSQITEPTEGEIQLRGRLASLLEVGTGFHQELSGRENIFLNGAVLGMSKAEIRRKFDEIVAFAEVEKFLDTPVKRYSSGMYVRLAFAVAAHLEPEILLVDEVLAVGDAAFQNKCLGKMQDVAQHSGRTVLFVSHNMSAVQTLCGRAVYLQQGRVKGIGGVEEQIGHYLDEMRLIQSGHTELNVALGPALRLGRLLFQPNPVISGAGAQFTLEVSASRDTRLSDLQILVYSPLGARVAMIDLRQHHGDGYRLANGQSLVLEGRIRSLPLIEGDYRVGVFYSYHGNYADVLDLVTLHLAAAPPKDQRVPYKPVHRGLIALETEFEAKVGK